MKKDIYNELAEIKYEIYFQEIVEFNRFEERFFEIELYFGDILGMCEGYVEFCPNNSPADLEEELLPWLWLIRPDLSEDIILLAENKLKEIIFSYNNG